MTKQTELAIIQPDQALIIFRENKTDSFISGIEKEVEEFKKTSDVSTPKGRAEIRAMANKVAKTKAPFDKAGLRLTEEARDRIDKVNAERKRIKEKLQLLQDDVRQPLTDYEDKEKKRIEVRRNRIEEIENSLVLMKLAFNNKGSDMSNEESIKWIKSHNDTADELIKYDWQEFEFKAKTEYQKVKDYAAQSIEILKKEDKQYAELEKLRKEKEEREKKDREEQIIRETEENIRRVEREKAEKVAKEAEEQRYRLEAEKKAAEQAKINAENRIIAATKIANNLKEQAKIQAKKDQEEAVRHERARVQAERQKQIDEERARAENLEHKTEIYKEIIAALLPYVNNNMEATAKTKAIIAGIAKGKIPYISIKF